MLLSDQWTHEYIALTGHLSSKSSFILLQEHHEEDFFLYIAYSDESVYGAE